jgi:hypothetical protein
VAYGGAEPGVVARSRAAGHLADLGCAGFGSGGPLDVLLPDPVLAFAAAGAHDGGLGQLSDDELIGLLGAARRLSSWQAAVELDAVAELDRRRAAPPAGTGGGGSSRAGEQVSAELAAALTLTGRSADALLCLARDLPPGRPRSAGGDRAPPAPPAPVVPAALMAWLTSLQVEWLERGDCGHQRQGSSYRPGRIWSTRAWPGSAAPA